MALAVSLPIWMGIGDGERLKVGAFEPKVDVSGATINLSATKQDLAAALRQAANVLDSGPDNEPEEIRHLPAEVRTLVHAVDRVRGEWAEADLARRDELWQMVHAANDAVWAR